MMLPTTKRILCKFRLLINESCQNGKMFLLRLGLFFCCIWNWTKKPLICLLEPFTKAPFEFQFLCSGQFFTAIFLRQKKKTWILISTMLNTESSPPSKYSPQKYFIINNDGKMLTRNFQNVASKYFKTIFAFLCIQEDKWVLCSLLFIKEESFIKHIQLRQAIYYTREVETDALCTVSSIKSSYPVLQGWRKVTESSEKKKSIIYGYLG